MKVRNPGIPGDYGLLSIEGGGLCAKHAGYRYLFAYIAPFVEKNRIYHLLY